VAAVGVVLAAFYAIRLFQRTMHNRLPEGRESREIGLRDAAVLAPLVACIVGLALYPGLILGRANASVEAKVGAAGQLQGSAQPTVATTCALPSAACGLR
jgi:NADH-quinone oxidoreductase subunit M